MTQANSSTASSLLKSWFGVFSSFFPSDDSEPKPPEKQPPAQGPKPIVLVIDDDERYLETVRDLLAGTPFRVLTANSGAKGLEILRHCREDLELVLLDYCMPRLDGMKTLEYARKLNPQVKVIGVVDGDDEQVPASFREDVQQLVTKSVGGPDLIAMIHRLTDDRPAQPAAG